MDNNLKISNQNHQQIKKQLFSMTHDLILKWQQYLNFRDHNMAQSKTTVSLQKNWKQSINPEVNKRHNRIKQEKSYKRSITERSQQSIFSQNSIPLRTPKSKFQIQQLTDEKSQVNQENSMLNSTKFKKYKTSSKLTSSTNEFYSANLIEAKPESEIVSLQQSRSLRKYEKYKIDQTPIKSNSEFLYLRQEAQYLRSRFLNHLSHFHNEEYRKAEQQRIKAFVKQKRSK